MNLAIKLKCPNCDSPIHSGDINIQKMVAKCSKCGCVFPFKTRLFTPYSVPLKSSTNKIPDGIKVHRQGENQEQGKELFLTYRWWNKRYFTFMLIAGLWNISAIMWFAITLANEAYFMVMLGMVYAIAGIALLYLAIAGFLNETVIKVDEYQLSVTHNPVPWLLCPKLRCDNIEQLYCTLHINRGRHYTRYSYELNVILKKKNKHICILKGIESGKQAQYLEQEIERFLKIKDTYVKGEYVPQR
ncbi:MAG: hypothetical protein AB8B69_11505 [Chitinophagales bacterium]